MKYGHILNYVARSLWAIDPSKMQSILSVLAFRAAGGEFTAEEIRANLDSIERTSPAATNGRGVAIVPLRGTICHRMGSMDESSGGMSAERFSRMFNRAIADDSVGTVIIDADTPGGTVNGVMEAADTVYESRGKKPIIAVCNGLMASAGYWIGSQADEIVAVPGLLSESIGSIGVYMVHADLTAHLEKEGIKVTVIRSGDNKFAGNPFEPLSDEELAKLQARSDAVYAAFVKGVARGRGVTTQVVKDEFGQGAAFPAKEAKAIGLVDRIATFDDVIAKAVGRRGRSQVGGARASQDGLVPAAEATGGAEGEQPSTAVAPVIAEADALPTEALDVVLDGPAAQAGAVGDESPEMSDAERDAIAIAVALS